MRYITFMDTCLGSLVIKENGRAVVAVSFQDRDTDSEEIQMETPILENAKKQIEEYFAGKRTEFDFPMEPEGTAFQHRVWDALLTIPYGQIRSYGEIARQIGNPKACRAVGGANHNNPIAIAIPCHRVVGAGGGLTGYGGGLDKKDYLLKLEQGEGKDMVSYETGKK